jgi:hypothetical protein
LLNIDADALITSYVAAQPGMAQAVSTGFATLVHHLAADDKLSDVRFAAYMLATVKHECAGAWQPIEESGKGAHHPYGVPVQVQDSDGTTYLNTYYGRGYVQLTWKMNYDRSGRAIGLGNALVLHPEHALEPETAYTIMSFGMRTGLFTGKKLSDYIHGDVCDYRDARRIINKLDRADLIQGYAVDFEKRLREVAQPAAAAASVGGS